LVPCYPVKSKVEAFKAAVRKLGSEAAARLASGSAPTAPRRPGQF